MATAEPMVEPPGFDHSTWITGYPAVNCDASIEITYMQLSFADKATPVFATVVRAPKVSPAAVVSA
jgi:hypothetical protein